MTSVSLSGNNSSGLQIGINHGSITAEFHPPSVRAETPPPNPSSNVPYPREPDFVGRNTLLQWIHEKNSVPGSRIALVGLGGAGKSQLAIEYSYRIRSESPATWVFWVHASNESRFKLSFQDIANQLNIPGSQDPKINIFGLVENRLRDEKTGKWICILDNVDDEKFLCLFPASSRDPTKDTTDTLSKPLLQYIPRSQNGSIIITSRSRDAALNMVSPNDLLEVKPMEESEALELLQRKLDQPGGIHESQELVNALEFMPLAIVQAASYIRNRAPRRSVSQYLRNFQKSDHEAIKLLKKEERDLSRDREAKNSILVTWQISFDHLCQTKPSAADLLSFMSFFDRQGIPENLILRQAGANYKSDSEHLDGLSDGETPESDTAPDIEDDIQVLRDYSFISVNESGNLFMMHRLVQLTMRAWLKSQGQINQWRNKFISTLFKEFPTGEYENWETCRPLFPHVKSAISQRPASHECLLQWAALLYRGAWYASKCGNIADVREMASKSRDQMVLLLDNDHEDVINSTSMLATAYQLEGQWQKAEQLNVQVLKISKIKFGEDHPNTLTSMANLASTFWNQGRWEEAEQLEMQVLKISKIKFGEEHPDTLTSMANLASTFWNQGRWEEAEQLGVQVLKISKIKFGEDHPDTLKSMANLASTFWNQGRWEEAEQLEMHVMETRIAKLGEDHPSTLTSMANLASTYRDQGRWEEAEQLDVQVLKISKIKFGEDHPDTLKSMANLASTFWNQGRWEEAEQLEMHVMETRIAKLGEDHPSTLTSMVNLAFTWKSSGHIVKAISLLRECLAKRKKILGLKHPSTVSTSEALSQWETELNVNALNL